MKRSITLTLALGCLTLLHANPREKALRELVSAELAFAELAAKTNTPEAFLTYLTDDAIMFSNGPCNGKSLYAGRPADSSLLAWAPDFADVAASGDFGFDTGPYTYRPKRTDEKPAGHGHFVTVWKKQPSGEWRVIFDTGYKHPAPDSAVFPAVQYSAIAFEENAAKKLADPRRALLEAENAFNTRLHKDGPTAYRSILSPEARRLRRGLPPAISPKSILEQLETFAATETLQYEPIEAATASSGDLGFVYGWVTTTGTSADKPAPQRSNYVRFWKRENGQDWRLVLELTGPG
jgi:ketosteroid isomerase-like protein